MKITILGAAGGEVTGSAYLVETQKARLLVDCGLFQGGKRAEEMNRLPQRSRPAQLDAVLLTHAHLDHTGRLPLLGQAGFKGPIFATQATIEMTGLILRDAAKIQAQDAERHNRKRIRAGEAPVGPLFTLADVERILQQLQPVPYKDLITVAPGVQARFVEAGHMLGSTSIQLLFDEVRPQRKVVFSGDLGPKGAPILRDSEPFSQADVLFLESTYGDHNHRPFADTVREFIEILKAATASKSKVLVPTFAVGRAQLLTTLLGWCFRKKMLEPFPVYLDSPMAIEASRIYAAHPELFDDEMLAFLKEKPLAQDLATLKMTPTAEESKQINDCTGPCLVMAGAGMCNAGRIQHHLRNNLWKPETHVLIVGYQGNGTLGRLLVEGEKKVTIFGETVAVKAKIHTLGGFSAHAGQSDLLSWFGVLAPSRPRVYLTHGDDAPRAALARLIAEKNGRPPTLPALGAEVDL